MMREEIHADGGSAESSPSYCLFIARIYLDAFALMTKNSVPEIKGLQASLQKQYTWISHMASPKRETLLFNDSATMDVDTDLKIVSSVFPLKPSKPKASFVFPDSQMGRITNKHFQVYFDATPQRDRWHDHHGKPTLIVYADGQPLIVDSGCCNYDHFLREQYLTRSQAHNAIQIHGKPELNCGEENQQALPEILIQKFKPTPDGGEITFRHSLRWQEYKLDYVWVRKVTLKGRTLRVSDQIKSNNKLTATSRFHFAPLNLVLNSNRECATILFHGRDVQVDQLRNATLKQKPAVGLDNLLTYTSCLAQSASGQRLSFNFRIRL